MVAALVARMPSSYALADSPLDGADGLIRSRRAALSLVILHGLVVWSAVALRVDTFPLSWAPMYTVLRPGPVLSTPVWDRTQALLATRRDGRSETLDADVLNIPRLSFWRLYYKRMFGRGPAKHEHARVREEWNEGLRRALGIGDTPERDWERIVLDGINRTLGRDATSPDFIVQITARADVLRFDRRRPGEYERAEWFSAYRYHDEVMRDAEGSR